MKKLIVIALAFASVTAAAEYRSDVISIGEEGTAVITYKVRAQSTEPVSIKCYSAGESSHEVACDTQKTGQAVQKLMNRLAEALNLPKGKSVDQFPMANGG